MINYILRQKKENEWRRVLFYIPSLKKRIKREFDPKILYNKLDFDDVDIILTLLEKESSKFHWKRLFTKVKIFYLILILTFVILSLLYTFYYKKLFIALIHFFIALIFSFQYFFCILNFFRKKYVKVHKSLYPLILNINRKLLNNKGLYLMINPNFTYINIYLVPSFIQATVHLQNFIYESDDEEKKNYCNKDLTFNNTTDILNAYIQAKQGFGLL